jgi:hypothetical protein
MSSVHLPVLDPGADLAKKQKSATGGRSTAGHPFNFRMPPELLANLKEIADGLSLDAAAVARMILSENVGPYLERAREALAKRRPSSDPPPD